MESTINMKVKPATPSKKSIFVKKSNCASSGNTVKFNFDSSKEDDISNNISHVKKECEDSYNKSDTCSTKNNDYHYVPSNNSFRFRFNASEEL
ncbi:hypothetical protein NQ314_006892 [Rhamnusium bicolor]|uniref:Uncharacterized protein n=1 Tax=Rhamnusium bicolor TaxID=1586634 RepID=A0AAV8YX32_9CUCU|nr:hypothetical protein NQ314_006892 [Rhamnusium bicolor]